MLCYICHTLMTRSVQLAIVGTGEAQYEQALTSIARQYPGRMVVRLAFDPGLADRMYAGADAYLMPSRSEPCGLSQLIAMHYGTIPVVHATGGLVEAASQSRRRADVGVEAQMIGLAQPVAVVQELLDPRVASVVGQDPPRPSRTQGVQEGSDALGLGVAEADAAQGDALGVGVQPAGLRLDEVAGGDHVGVHPHEDVAGAGVGPVGAGVSGAPAVVGGGHDPASAGTVFG